MKNNRIILILLLGVIFSCKEAQVAKKTTYTFKRGSPLMHDYPPKMKLIKPVLTIIQNSGKTEFYLPLGTIIWRDQSLSGYLIIKYMDKRFSAFGSDAYELVDMERKTIIPIVTDVIAEIDANRDDILIGVQRIATHAHLIQFDFGYDYTLNDYDYNECIYILFIIRFDFEIGRFYRVNLITGFHLPDWNQVFEYNSEYEKKMKKKFYVKDNILYYSLDPDDKIMMQFKLPGADFLYSSVEKYIGLKKK